MQSMRQISQLLDITGRKALITGGAGHIGSAAAETLVELGASVAVLDVDESACLKAVDRLCQLRPNSAVAIHCDLGDEARTREAVQSALHQLGGLEILIHCAAGAQRTGVIVLLYRHIIQGQDLAQAYLESFQYKHKPDEWRLLAYVAQWNDEIAAALRTGEPIPGFDPIEYPLASPARDSG